MRVADLKGVDLNAAPARAKVRVVDAMLINGLYYYVCDGCYSVEAKSHKVSKCSLFPLCLF